MIIRLSSILKVFCLFVIILISVVLFKMFEKKNNDDVISITFIEGINICEIANLLQSNGIVNKKEFFESCKSAELREEFSFLNGESNEKYYPLEGYLFPDTYNFVKNEDSLSVLRKFLKNFENKIKKVNVPEKFSLDEILTIASVLEAESSIECGPDVSSVIHNRLSTLENNGISKFGEYGLGFLQLESTMYYPYRFKEEAPDNFESIYNTYKIKGLPPGSICCPGLRFIQDAANPHETDYFYFCNDKEGKIYFAQTYKEHCENLKIAGVETKKS